MNYSIKLILPAILGVACFFLSGKSRAQQSSSSVLVGSTASLPPSPQSLKHCQQDFKIVPGGAKADLMIEFLRARIEPVLLSYKAKQRQGYVYDAFLPPDITPQRLQRLGIDQRYLKGLTFFSQFEGGNPAALNTWDQASLSLSTFQFAAPYSLPDFLAFIHRRAPLLYDEYLFRYGFQVRFNQYQEAEIGIFTQQGKMLYREAAVEHVRQRPELLGALIQLMKQPEAEDLMLQFAVQRYFEPTLQLTFRHRAHLVDLRQWFQEPMSYAAFALLSILNGVGTTQVQTQQILKAYIDRGCTPDQFDEKVFWTDFQHLYGNDQRVEYRLNMVLYAQY